jgi:hypothetical protein
MDDAQVVSAAPEHFFKTCKVVSAAHQGWVHFIDEWYKASSDTVQTNLLLLSSWRATSKENDEHYIFHPYDISPQQIHAYIASHMQSPTAQMNECLLRNLS